MMITQSLQQPLKHKVERIVLLLEAALGIPEQKARKAKPLDMLIATILSQNTNDQNSYRAYCQLRKKFPIWESVLTAKTASVASAIKTGGMANQKSVCIKKLLTELKKRYGTLDLSILNKKSNEEILEILTSFDGVGNKTAACVLLFSLRREVFPVDTHIHRICNRLGLTSEVKTPDKAFTVMQNIVPEGKAYSFHTNLIRFGRKICKANNPLCGECPLFDECVYKEKEKFRQSASKSAIGKNSDFMLLDNVAN